MNNIENLLDDLKWAYKTLGPNNDRGWTPESILKFAEDIRKKIITEFDNLTKARDGYYNEAAEGWKKFRETERTIAQHDVRIAELEQLRDDLSSSLHCTEGGVSLLTEWLAERDARIAELEKALDVEKAAVRAAQAATRSREEAIRQTDAALVQVRAAVAERDARIAELEEEKRDWEHTQSLIEKQDARIAELEALNLRHREEMEYWRSAARKNK